MAEFLIATTREVDLKINRKQTINLEIESYERIETSEILRALKYRGLLTNTECVQQAGKNRFRISMRSENCAIETLRTLTATPLIVGECESKSYYAANQTIYMCYDIPWEVSTTKLAKLLGEYGTVKNIKWLQTRDEAEVYDGRAIVTFASIHTKIPMHFKLGPYEHMNIKVPAPRARQLYCYKCRTRGDHAPEDCSNQTICDICKEEGHRKATCPNNGKDQSDRQTLDEEGGGHVSSVPLPRSYTSSTSFWSDFERMTGVG